MSVSKYLYLLILSYTLTDMLLSVGTDIPILLLSLTTIPGLFFFIFLSFWIEKSSRIIASFASIIGSCWFLNHHHDPIFHYNITPCECFPPALADGLSLD